MIRAKPLPADIQSRLHTLGRTLEACPAVVFAYLFGSAATRTLRPLSDVDVAVYVDESADPADARLEILQLLTRHLGTDEVDLVVLDMAPTALAGRILGTRRVILDRDPFRRHRFESQVLRQFMDFRVLEHRLLSRRFARG
ncbi:MAG: nucleotidyltransferase domain-containing protein [Candidatus Rokubacteria bacterium]|nr:nucleotidyltransferase domain-containing protein [Candidatus Rokubacteria bacterium]